MTPDTAVLETELVPEEAVEDLAVDDAVTPEASPSSHVSADPPPVPVEPTGVLEPTRFTAMVPAPEERPTSVEQDVLMQIMNLRRRCREPEVGIAGIQFQVRPSAEDDEISHHDHTVYDIRYLDPNDSRIYVAMQDRSLQNRIFVGRIRLHRATSETGPVRGFYFWDMRTDNIVRLGDHGPETEGTTLDTLPGVDYMVGG